MQPYIAFNSKIGMYNDTDYKPIANVFMKVY